DWSKAGKGFNERLTLRIHGRAGELCDLLIERVQTRFHGSNSLEQSHQGWSTGRGQIGIGHRVSSESFKSRRFWAHHPVLLESVGALAGDCVSGGRLDEELDDSDRVLLE